MKFFCIADEDTVRGIRLAGVAAGAAAAGRLPFAREGDERTRLCHRHSHLPPLRTSFATGGRVRLERDCPSS
jgi:hypothetical protein